MQFDLISGTDAGRHVLYDPASVMHLLTSPYDDWYADLRGHAGPANLISYNNGGDGDAKFRVFVDEAPPSDIAQRALAKQTGHLKVPSGRLFASGMEYLDSRGKPPAAPEEFQLRTVGMGTERSIPPGVYDVEAYDLDPESEEVERALGLAEEAARARHPMGARLALVHQVLGLAGILHFVSFVAVAILVIFFIGAREAGWMLLESKWGIVYKVLAGIWAARIFLRLLPPVSAFYRLINVEAEKHPLTVVILTRRATPPETLEGVSFGEIDLPQPARPSYTVP